MAAMEVFVKWMLANKPYLTQCRGRQLIVASAGDEASMVCLYLLNGVSEDYGFKVSAVLCPTPEHRFQDVEAVEGLVAFWRSLGVVFTIAWPCDDDSFEERSCAGCRRRRSEAILLSLERYSTEDVVLVTGHHLVDLMALVVDRFILTGPESPPLEERTLLSVPEVPFGVGVDGRTLFAPLLTISPGELRDAWLEWSLPSLEGHCRYRPSSTIGHLRSYLEGLGDRFSDEGALGFIDRHLPSAQRRRPGSTIVSGTSSSSS